MHRGGTREIARDDRARRTRSAQSDAPRAARSSPATRGTPCSSPTSSGARRCCAAAMDLLAEHVAAVRGPRRDGRDRLRRRDQHQRDHRRCIRGRDRAAGRHVRADGHRLRAVRSGVRARADGARQRLQHARLARDPRLRLEGDRRHRPRAAGRARPRRHDRRARTRSTRCSTCPATARWRSAIASRSSSATAAGRSTFTTVYVVVRDGVVHDVWPIVARGPGWL